jgi:hypothetical protein
MTPIYEIAQYDKKTVYIYALVYLQSGDYVAD